MTKEHKSHGPPVLRIGIIGSVIAAICCVTTLPLILLGAVGFGWLAGYLDFVAVPALAIFLGLTVFALWQNRKKETAPNEHNT